MERKPWANTTQARMRAYQAAADILCDYAHDAGTFAGESLRPEEIRAAQFYLEKIANQMQQKAFELEAFSAKAHAHL